MVKEPKWNPVLQKLVFFDFVLDFVPVSLFVAGWCCQLYGDTENFEINFSNSTWVKPDQQQARQLISNTDRWDLMGARGAAIKQPHTLA